MALDQAAGLEADGVVGRATIASLNLGAEHFERRIAINMERAWRLARRPGRPLMTREAVRLLASGPQNLAALADRIPESEWTEDAREQRRRLEAEGVGLDWFRLVEGEATASLVRSGFAWWRSIFWKVRSKAP